MNKYTKDRYVYVVSYNFPPKKKWGSVKATSTNNALKKVLKLFKNKAIKSIEVENTSKITDETAWKIMKGDKHVS